MSTNSYIGMKTAKDSVVMIYCHWDGYPDYNGKILCQNYTDPDKVKQLMKLGNISSLRPELGKKQDFDTPNEKWTISYKRDRGEKDESSRKFPNVKEAMEYARGNYVYLFSLSSNSWECWDGQGRKLSLSRWKK